MKHWGMHHPRGVLAMKGSMPPGCSHELEACQPSDELQGSCKTRCDYWALAQVELASFFLLVNHLLQ